jgi:hypothetical protein
MLIPSPLKGESPTAFKAFKVYVELGHERTMKLVASRLACSLQNIKRFAIKHHWPDRLAILIAEEAEREAVAERQAKLDAAKKREQMRLNHEAYMYKLLETTRQRIEQFASLPIVKSKKIEEITDAEGRTIAQTILVEPSNMNWSSFVRALAQVDSSTRLLLGMPTGKTEVVGADGLPLLSGSNAPIINVVLTRDDQSDKVDAIQKEYLEQHSEHPQSQRILREYRDLDKGNGH